MRRHSTMIDVTMQHHLACQLLDPERGVFAVVKSFSSNSAPIHVQKQTWGANPQMRCELDSCVRNTEVMHRSGFVSFDCVHLRSLQYCPPPSSSQLELREDVLRDVVSSRWFGEERKRACLSRKKEAKAEGIPLSVEVEVRSSSSRRYVSIYDSNLSYYNRFGRVMVMFDTTHNSWHCDCVKVKQSCIHKAIAKWHLFQSRRELFTGDESESPEESEEEQGQTFSLLQYPPQDQDLKRIVRYTQSQKRIPVNLPAEMFGLESETQLPKHLMPKESVCPECPGHPLGQPFIICSTARIITIKGVIEGRCPV